MDRKISTIVKFAFNLGLGYFINKLGLGTYLPFFKRVVCPMCKEPMDLPCRFRCLLEKLGGAWPKLGQFLSLRPDLIPPEWCEELSKLLDEMSPVPFEEVKKTIEDELKRPLKEAFRHFDEKPIGTASVAQVHKAKLKTGEIVAVKILRPQIEELFKADIKIMYYLATKLQRRWPEFDFITIVKEFERYSNSELNLLQEASSLDRFYKAFRPWRKIKIPKPYWNLTTKRVLTMDFIDGTKLTAILKANKKAKIDLEKEMRLMIDCAFNQIFNLGFYHADMHPGNILILPNHGIGILDFGIVGEVPKEAKNYLLKAFYYSITNEPEKAFNNILKLAIVEPGTDIEDFKQIVNQKILEIRAAPPGTRVSKYFLEAIVSGIRMGLKFPSQVVLFSKALLTAEGTVLAMNPKFNFIENVGSRLKTYVEKYEALTPEKIISQTGEVLQEIVSIPKETLGLMDWIKRSKIALDLANTDIRHLGLDIHSSGAKLSYAIVLAAFLITAGLFSRIGLTALSIVSLIGAGLTLIPFAFEIFKAGKKPYDPHKEK